MKELIFSEHVTCQCQRTLLSTDPQDTRKALTQLQITVCLAEGLLNTAHHHFPRAPFSQGQKHALWGTKMLLTIGGGSPLASGIPSKHTHTYTPGLDINFSLTEFFAFLSHS